MARRPTEAYNFIAAARLKFATPIAKRFFIVDSSGLVADSFHHMTASLMVRNPNRSAAIPRHGTENLRTTFLQTMYLTANSWASIGMPDMAISVALGCNACISRVEMASQAL